MEPCFGVGDRFWVALYAILAATLLAQGLLSASHKSVDEDTELSSARRIPHSALVDDVFVR